jgi:RNA polymerase sigma-70 factor (ECF subfamily)
MAAEIDIEAIYRKYGDLVYGRCRTLLGNDADAAEVMQDVFIRLMRYADGFRGEASPSTYLFKITTTTCLNRIRTRKRRREDMVEELPPAAANDTLLDELELRQLLDVLLADEDERTVSCVVYHYVDGMTHDEAGAMLGVSGAAVRKRIAKFKERVRANPPDWMEDQ